MKQHVISSSVRYASFVILGLMLFTAVINIQFGNDNLNIMRVYDADATYAVTRLQENIEKGDLDPRDDYNYGYFYHTLVYRIVQILNTFGYDIDSTNVRFIAMTFRLISLLSYAVLLFAVYKMFCLLNDDKIMAALAILFLASVKSFYYWGHGIHPDVLQVMLITLAFLIAFSKHTFQRALLSAVVAGLAFGTKYSGVFAMPFLFLPSFLAYVNEVGQRSKKFKFTFKNLKKPILVVLIMGVLFIAMWLITNPYVLSHFSEFQKDLSYEREHVARGHGRAEPVNPFLWFSILQSDITWFGCLLMLIGIGLFLFSLIKKYLRSENFIQNESDRTVLTGFLYIILFWLSMMFMVKMRRPRYLFPFYPIAILLVFHGFYQMKKIISEKRQWFVYLLLFVLILPISIHAIKAMNWAPTTYEHPNIRATEFIEQNYPNDVSILADVYSYQSPKFTRYQSFMGVNHQLIEQFKPLLVMLNKRCSGRWSWKKPGTKFSDLEFQMGTHDNAQYFFRFHKVLFASSSQYKVVYEDDTIVILQRKDYSPSSVPN